METTFYISMGDRFDDGHGRYEIAHLKANKSHEELLQIQNEAQKIVNFDYIFQDENTLTQDEVNTLKEKGIDFSSEVLVEQCDLYEDVYWFNPESAAELYVQAMKLIDKTLEIEVIDDDVPCLCDFGYALVGDY